ncbi:MAG TPA: sigma-70 family RNA polymerase sigma factor [Actinomycetota bacterium]|nr:sigma-70 family RNA polymerase sigma factor [Actinomycetota bacterium]
MVTPELLQACRRGERGAFEELVERTRRQVYSMARRLMRDAHEAEDVAQEVYLRVYRGLPTFRQEASFETWLYRIVANTAFTQMRRRGRFGDVAPEPMGDEAPSRDRPLGEAAMDRDDLTRALAKLPAASRAVVVLRDVYGLTMKEIASEMGTSEGAVKVRLHRARTRLRELLAEDR